MKIALKWSYSSLFKLSLKKIRIRVFKFYFKSSKQKQKQKQKTINKFFWAKSGDSFEPLYVPPPLVCRLGLSSVLYLSVAAKVAMSCVVFSRGYCVVCWICVLFGWIKFFNWFLHTPPPPKKKKKTTNCI